MSSKAKWEEFIPVALAGLECKRHRYMYKFHLYQHILCVPFLLHGQQEVCSQYDFQGHQESPWRHWGMGATDQMGHWQGACSLAKYIGLQNARFLLAAVQIFQLLKVKGRGSKGEWRFCSTCKMYFLVFYKIYIYIYFILRCLKSNMILKELLKISVNEKIYTKFWILDTCKLQHLFDVHQTFH